MNKNIENILATLDDFRTNDEMTYSTYSTLHDEISLLNDLLKEQGPVKIKVKKINDNGRCGQCPNCRIELNETDYPNYCGYCGQAVKWDDY